MSDEAISILTAISSGPLNGGSLAMERIDAPNYRAALSRLLGQMNGFYSFESALHVFPVGGSSHMSLERWNSADLWRNEYGKLAEGLLFFAEDLFGGQFTLSERGVGSFDPETGAQEYIAPDLEIWAARLLSDYDVLTGYPLAHDWQARHGAIPEGKRLLPRVPFVAGGAFDITNLVAVDAVEGMRIRGSIAVQICDLPDGTPIQFRFAD